VYLYSHTKKETHNSFDWFNFVHYSSLFQHFFLIYYSPYSSWKFLIFLVYLFGNFFWNTIIMIMIEIQYRGSFRGSMEPSFLPQSWQTFNITW